MIKLNFDFPIAQVSDRGLTAKVETGELLIAHMGCMLPATTLPKKLEFPDQHLAVTELLDKHYGARKAWKTPAKATELLGKSLLSISRLAESKGIQLFDTIRSGSDYWRPGKLLTDSVEAMKNLSERQFDVSVGYGRLDELCPSSDLLREFRADESMTFGQYAERYATELRSNGGLELAIAELIMQNSRGRIPVFYCTDPYIKGYCRSDDWLGQPYLSRGWLGTLRETGCHRVILVEEIIRRVVDRGFTVRLFELDQLDQQGVHQRIFVGSK